MRLPVSLSVYACCTSNTKSVYTVESTLSTLANGHTLPNTMKKPGLPGAGMLTSSGDVKAAEAAAAAAAAAALVDGGC